MTGLRLRLGVHSPIIAGSAWIASGAVVVGDVQLAEGVSIWYGAVLRGDGARITIGAQSNIQDGAVIHSDPQHRVQVGSGVSVGHRATLHGCAIGTNSLIGIGAVVLNGASVGAGCLVAAGTVLLEGVEVPARSLVAGVPGEVKRQLTDSELASVVANAQHYSALAHRHRDAAPI